MTSTDAHDSERYTTSRLAAASGYSVQQIRDLKRLEVIPSALRQPNGYRQFTGVHVTALRAYRGLAIAVGPVVARAMMREIHHVTHDEAVARIVGLHVDLARSRGDTMSITELYAALGVRSSTLRFWEQEGLITPERAEHLSARRYPPDAVRDARIVAALRASGYRIPAVHSVMTSLRSLGNTADAREALQDRLQTISARSGALLRAGTDLSDLLG